MTNSEFPPGGDYVYEITEELSNTMSIKGAPYNNIVLTTDEPGFVDVFDEAIIVRPEAMTFYWPGGSPGHDGDFETVGMARRSDNPSPAALAEQTTTTRNAILSASIGAVALQRVPADITQVWERLQQMQITPLLLAESHSATNGLPLALCQTSRVVQSTVADKDSRMLHLWYPAYVSPKPVLARMRQVVRGVIAAETQ